MSSQLICPVCETSIPPGPDEPWKCPHCEGPLELPESGAERMPEERQDLWTFTDRIPVDRNVSLGEGLTPEVEEGRLGASLKLEYLSPSSSFKDRGVTTMLSRAAEMDVTKIINDSSGNAGFSTALYGAKAGINVKIYAPASAPQKKLTSIERVGAEVVPIEGSRRDVKNACISAASQNGIWYASHWWRPSFLAGTKTVAFESVQYRGGTAPDIVILPVGAGTLFLGAYRGFRELKQSSEIDTMPRLVAAQAAGYASLSDQSASSQDNTNKVAKGIHIADPPRQEEIAGAIGETGGDAIAVTETETYDALDKLHRMGYYVEPTCAVALAALDRLKNDGQIRSDDDVLVPLTGSGFKSDFSD